jgi:hypothetical protein
MQASTVGTPTAGHNATVFVALELGVGFRATSSTAVRTVQRDQPGLLTEAITQAYWA